MSRNTWGFRLKWSGSRPSSPCRLEARDYRDYQVLAVSQEGRIGRLLGLEERGQENTPEENLSPGREEAELAIA